MTRVSTRMSALERVLKPPQAAPLSPGQERWIQFHEAHPKWLELWAQIRLRWPTGRINITEVVGHPEFRDVLDSISDEFWAQEHAKRRASGAECDCRSFDHPQCDRSETKAPLW